MHKPSEKLLRQEVEELTSLLRSSPSFAHLRRMLSSQGTDPFRIVLAGLIEGEDESSYGVIISRAAECIVFELSGDEVLQRWEAVDDPDQLSSDFEAVVVGVRMVRAGEIA